MRSPMRAVPEWTWGDLRIDEWWLDPEAYESCEVDLAWVAQEPVSEVAQAAAAAEACREPVILAVSVLSCRGDPVGRPGRGTASPLLATAGVQCAALLWHRQS
jgi:hypothetical protein